MAVGDKSFSLGPVEVAFVRHALNTLAKQIERNVTKEVNVEVANLRRKDLELIANIRAKVAP